MVSPIIQRERDYEGAVRLLTRLQSAGKWIVQWPLIAAGVYGILRYFGIIDK